MGRDVLGTTLTWGACIYGDSMSSLCGNLIFARSSLVYWLESLSMRQKVVGSNPTIDTSSRKAL